MQETKQRIMASALELFLTDSYYRVSIDQIAERAGVSKGGIFHHFESKYRLAREALVGAFTEQWLEGFRALEAVPDPQERIRHVIRMSIEMGAESAQMMKVVFEVMQEGIRQGDSSQDMAIALSSFEEPVARWLAECGVPTPQVKAVILIAALDGLMAQVAMFDASDRNLDMSEFEESFFELFVGNYVDDSTGQMEVS